MPFIAIDPHDNRPRIPVSVGDDEEVQCPVCNESLYVRDGPDIARHFYHPPDSSCGGESALHLAMKSIAVDKLQQTYPDADVHIEFKTKEVPRRADVFVEFGQPSFPLGNGIAVEVQYRHEQKDLTETTASYLTGSISVLWLFEENYEGTHPDYDDVDLPPPIPVWPHSIPHGDTTTEDTSAASQLGLSEETVISQLPNHADGQLSLIEFPETDPTPQPTAPDWELTREVYLNISLNTPGIRDIYYAWVDGQIEKYMNKFTDTIRPRRKDVQVGSRSSYIIEPFRTGPGAMFRLIFRFSPSNSDSLTLKKFANETRTHTTRLNADTVDELYTLVKNLCFELAKSQTATPPNSEIEPSGSRTVGALSYTLSQTQSNAIMLTTREDAGSLSVQFHPQDISGLIKFCAKVTLWYE